MLSRKTSDTIALPIASSGDGQEAHLIFVIVVVFPVIVLVICSSRSSCLHQP